MTDALTALGRMPTLWAPRASQIARSEIAKFIASIGGSVVDYKSFHAWSASDLEGFWGSVWEYAQIVGQRGTEAVRRDPSGDPGLTVFFPGARLNVAENLLRGAADRVAACFFTPQGVPTSLTIAELRSQVACLSDGLVRSDIGPGDVVVSTLPNGKERLIAYLACLARGAVWAQIPDDAKPNELAGLVDRIGGKILFTGASEAGLICRNTAESNGGEAGLQRLACIVVLGESLPYKPKCPVHAWSAFGHRRDELRYQRIAFNDPAVLLFDRSAGKLKAITHSAGGMLVTHLKEHILHGDIKKSDMVLSMNLEDPRLWLWQVSTIASGATAAFLDGGKSFDFRALQSLAQDLQATHLLIDPAKMEMPRGSSNAYSGPRPPKSLRALFLIDEVTDAALFDWIYKEFTDDIMLCPLLGSSKFLANYFVGSPLHPVRRGEYSALALGMALHVLDDGGRPVVARTGELVCSEAFPTMAKSTPFGCDRAASGGLPIGRRARITCYGSAVLCPAGRDDPSLPQAKSTRTNTKQSEPAPAAIAAARM
ncbi:MAG: AMP-binding protein [Pseudomonadota bacterium]